MRQRLVTLLGLVLLVAAWSPLQAQTDTTRTLLIEHYTSATCPPCASINPFLNRFLDTTSLDVVRLAYQQNFPTAGDPMNVANPAELNGRYQFYEPQASNRSIPRAMVNGRGYVNHNPGCFFTAQTSQNCPFAGTDTLYELAKLRSKFVVDVRTPEFVAGGDSIRFFMTIRTLDTAVANGANWVAHLVAVEPLVEYATSPAPVNPNGETEFHNVVREMLTGTNGSDGRNLPKTLLPGRIDTIDITVSKNAIPSQTIYNITAVGFIQDAQSPYEVHQTDQSAANTLPINIAIRPGAGTNEFNYVPDNTPVTLTYAVDLEQTSHPNFVFKMAGDALPTGWTAQIEVGGNTSSDSLTYMATQTNETVNVTITVTPDGVNGGKMDLTLQAYNADTLSDLVREAQAQVLSNAGDVLIINWREPYEDTLMNLLNRIGRTGVSVTVGQWRDNIARRGLFTNANTRAVWYNGSSNGYLWNSFADIVDSLNWMTGGGRLLITGHELASVTTFNNPQNGFPYGPNSSAYRFFERYCGVTFDKDSALSETITINTSDSFFGPLSTVNATFTTNFISNGRNILNMDVVQRSSNITGDFNVIAYYGDDTTELAAVRQEAADGSWKTAYYGMMFEFITPQNMKDTLLGRTFAWFDATDSSDTTVSRVEPASLGLAVFPNPAVGEATLNLDAQPADANLTLTDALGRTVRRWTAPAGATQHSLDLSGLVPALYHLSVQTANGQRATLPLVVGN